MDKKTLDSLYTGLTINSYKNYSFTCRHHNGVRRTVANLFRCLKRQKAIYKQSAKEKKKSIFKIHNIITQHIQVSKICNEKGQNTYPVPQNGIGLQHPSSPQLSGKWPEKIPPQMSLDCEACFHEP